MISFLIWSYDDGVIGDVRVDVVLGVRDYGFDVDMGVGDMIFSL